MRGAAAPRVFELKLLVYIMGILKVMTTDQGYEFKNKLNVELGGVLGIKHQKTTAYHPQANGLDERLTKPSQSLSPSTYRQMAKRRAGTNTY